MSFYDESARPWDFWHECHKAISGGNQTMARAPAAQAAELPTEATYQLVIRDVEARDKTWDLAKAPTYNPSLAIHDGRLKAIVRTARNGVTTNFLGEIQDKKLVGCRPVRELLNLPSRLGIEDCRLFVLDGALWVAATFSREKTTVPEMILLELRGGDFGAAYPQPSLRSEKNWIPVVDKVGAADRLRFVYACEPMTVLVFNSVTHAVVPSPKSVPEAKGSLRGGSQAVRHGDGWVAITHEVSGVGQAGAVYTHRFVRFDAELKNVAVGRPFYFQRKGIEFASGLLEHEGKWLVSYGVDDKRAFIAEVSRGTVDQFLQGV